MWLLAGWRDDGTAAVLAVVILVLWICYYRAPSGTRLVGKVASAAALLSCLFLVPMLPDTNYRASAARIIVISSLIRGRHLRASHGMPDGPWADLYFLRALVCTIAIASCGIGGVCLRWLVDHQIQSCSAHRRKGGGQGLRFLVQGGQVRARQYEQDAESRMGRELLSK